MKYLTQHLRNLSLISLVLILVIMAVYPVSLQAEETEEGYGYTYTFGSTGAELAYSVVNDQDDNVYLIGYFNGTIDFDPSGAVDNHTSAGGNDIFLTRINADGTYGYTKVIGSTGSDFARFGAIDDDGNIYITGVFNGTVDFDPNAGTDNQTAPVASSMFLTKITPDGTYVWTKTMGGTGSASIIAVTADSSGNSFLTGYFRDTVDFEPGAGTDNKTSAGNTDIFLTKINADGTYGYTKIIGNTSYDESYSVTTDVAGNVYFAGYFTGTVDFDPSGGTDNQAGSGQDGYVTRINADGSYGWTKRFGGATTDSGRSVTVDPSGNIYVSGSFTGTADLDFSAGTDNRTSVGGNDMFFVKINADGSYGYGKTMGGIGGEGSLFLYHDTDSNVYIVGSFTDTVDFNIGGAADNKTSAGGTDMYITKINADGSYGNTKTFGGTGNDQIRSVAITSDASTYLTGNFNATVDFDPTPATDNKTSAGSSDAFLTKLTQTTYQQITNLDPSLAAKTLTDTDATDNTIQNGTSATIRLSLSDTTPIADVTTTFTTDLNWSTVTADSNLTTGTAFAHNLTAADGTAGTFTLYVPKLPNHTRVGICPGASSLAATTEQCEGLYYLTENTDNNLTTTTIDTQDYWTITGLTGTGGFSAEAAATTTTTDSDSLAETGRVR